MSQLAHVVANVTLFSKSFNAGNVGTVKDAFYGLPAGLKAQLMEHSSAESAAIAMDFAKHKARIGLVRDMAFAIAITSLVQDWFRRDKDAEWSMGSVSKGLNQYQQRLADMWMNAKDNPFALDSYNPQRISSTWSNEKGKEDRVDMGADAGGRHEYMRLPAGKVYEDLLGWTMHPGDTFDNKMSPTLKAALGWKSGLKNKYGTPISDPNANMFIRAGQVAEFLVGTHIPIDQIKTGKDVISGHGTALDRAKLGGNFTGLTISQGNPHGPAAAEVYAVEDRMKAAKAFAMEAVKRDLKYGYEDAARSRLEAIGFSAREITKIINGIESPKQGMSKQSMKKFNLHSTEEERAKFDSLR